MSNLRPSESQLRATIDATRVHSRKRETRKLGEKIWTFGLPRKKKEAKPPVPVPVTSAMPTPERQARAPHGWQTQEHVGGQVSYRARSAMDTYKEHLDEHLVAAGARFVRDIETLDRCNVICSRAYTGMPFAMSKFDLGDEQAQSLAFIRWFEKNVDPRFVAAAAWLVIGIRPEAAPASDWAVKTSRYTGRDAKGVWTASSLKWTLVRLDEAYRAYALHVRWKKQEIEARKKLNGVRETSPVHVKRL